MSSLSTASDLLPSNPSESFYVKYLQQRQTPKCFEKGPQCITTPLYYFECCEDDCCARVQPMVKILLILVGVVVFLVIVMKANQRIRNIRQVRRNRAKVQSLLSESRIADASSEKKDFVAIQCW